MEYVILAGINMPIYIKNDKGDWFQGQDIARLVGFTGGAQSVETLWAHHLHLFKDDEYMVVGPKSQRKDRTQTFVLYGLNAMYRLICLADTSRAWTLRDWMLSSIDLPETFFAQVDRSTAVLRATAPADDETVQTGTYLAANLPARDSNPLPFHAAVQAGPNGELCVAGLEFEPFCYDNEPLFDAATIGRVFGYKSGASGLVNLANRVAGRLPKEGRFRKRVQHKEGSKGRLYHLFNARTVLHMALYSQAKGARKIKRVLCLASLSGTPEVEAVLANSRPMQRPPNPSKTTPSSPSMKGQDMNSIVKFCDTELRIIDQNGEPWFTGPDIGRALGYEEPRKSLGALFKRLESEFSDTETCVLTLGTQGDTQARQHRVFSRLGMHRLAMNAKSDRAKAFQEWVLDLLEGKAELPNHTRNLPAPTRSLAADPSQHVEFCKVLDALLDLHPRWRNVLYYSYIGLTETEICKLQDTTSDTLKLDKDKLRDLGFYFPRKATENPNKHDPLSLLPLVYDEVD